MRRSSFGRKVPRQAVSHPDDRSSIGPYLDYPRRLETRLPGKAIKAMPRVQRGSSGGRRSEPLRAADEELHLAVGPFGSDGKAFHELSFTGRPVAECRSEGTRALWNIRSQPSLYVVRTLYQLSGTPHYAVHAVLYSRRDDRPKLARVEAYPEWVGVREHHPDLARGAALESVPSEASLGEAPSATPVGELRPVPSVSRPRR